MPKSQQLPNDNPATSILSGLLILAGLFGGVVAWASTASLSGAVIAPGVMTVYSKRKTIQHLDGGIVAQIHVRDGDRAQADQLLIRLDDTRVRADLAVIDGQMDVLRARAARLTTERDERENVTFAADMLKRADATEILNGERTLFIARRETLRGEFAILNRRIDQLRQQIAGLVAQERSKARQIELINEEVNDLRQLYAQGHVPKTRFLALERAAEELEGERGGHVADIARTRSTISETELQVFQAKRVFRQEVVNEMHEVQAQIFDLEERRVAAADALNRVEIRAPQAGTVVGMEAHTIGGVISPGQPILDIVPEGDELVIEAQILPHDIDKVVKNQLAIVRLSAFNLRSTPELDGTVFTASADRLIDKASHQAYFMVGIRIVADQLAELDEIELVPGMPAEVFIQTGERTVLSFLVKPLADALSRTFRED